MPFQVISSKELRVREDRILYLMPPGQWKEQQKATEYEGGALRDYYKKSIDEIVDAGEKRITLAFEKTGRTTIGKEGFSDLFEAIDAVLETEDLMISFVMEQQMEDTYLDKPGKELRSLFSEKENMADFRYEMPMFSPVEADTSVCLDREGAGWKGQKQIRSTSLFSEPKKAAKEGSRIRKLKDLFQKQEETFQQMLLRLIREKGMTNAQVYKKANQDKKLFSKLKNDIYYQPKKKTAMAFALALELNLDEAKDLLSRAGYTFSPSSHFDQAIQYFIENQEYNIYEIEIVLYDLGLESLCNY